MLCPISCLFLTRVIVFLVTHLSATLSRETIGHNFPQFNNSLNLLTTNIFTTYLMDVTQLRIIPRLSPAWLVSLQDLSAGIAVPGLLIRGSSSTKLARHAFQDLGVRECTFRTIKHQSYKHRPKKIRKKIEFTVEKSKF